MSRAGWPGEHDKRARSVSRDLSIVIPGSRLTGLAWAPEPR